MLYYEKLKQFRQTEKITQRQIAEKLQITQQQYYKYESGQNELPIRYLVIICREYKISADWILGLTD